MVGAIEGNSFEPETQVQCRERNDPSERCINYQDIMRVLDNFYRPCFSYSSYISVNCSHPLEKESIKSLSREQRRGISRTGVHKRGLGVKL